MLQKSELKPTLDVKKHVNKWDFNYQNLSAGFLPPSTVDRNIYTTWKVDGATPMYWFIMAPYKSPRFGSGAIYFDSLTALSTWSLNGIVVCWWTIRPEDLSTMRTGTILNSTLEMVVAPGTTKVVVSNQGTWTDSIRYKNARTLLGGEKGECKKKETDVQCMIYIYMCVYIY